MVTIIAILLIIIGLAVGYYVGKYNGNLKEELWNRYLTDIAKVTDDTRDLKMKVSNLIYNSENVEQRVTYMIHQERRNEEMLYNPVDLNRQLVKYLSFLYQEDAKKYAMELELEEVEMDVKKKVNTIMTKYEK